MKLILSLILASISLIACQKPDANSLKVGVIAGPEAELMLVAKDVAEKQYGLKVKIIEFSDYNLPNEALDDGSLDANAFQHQAYLETATKAKGYDFAILAKTFIYPTGLYSHKYHGLENLPEGALIALPNDPSNELRALRLLEKANLIKLGDINTVSLRDIRENPKKLHFKELDAAQLPRVLADVDAAVINTNFAVPAGLSLNKDSLFQEAKDSPYVNLIVIKANSPKKAELEEFAKAYQSKEVKAKAEALFGHAAIPAWD